MVREKKLFGPMLVWPVCSDPQLPPRLDWNGFSQSDRKMPKWPWRPTSPALHQQADYLKWSLKSVADRSEFVGGIYEYSIFISLSALFQCFPRPQQALHQWFPSKTCLAAPKCLFPCPRLRHQPWGVLVDKRLFQVTLWIIKTICKRNVHFGPIQSFVWSGLVLNCF